MPLEIITNSVSAYGSLALLLHPTVEPLPAEVRSNAAPEAVAENLLGDWAGVRKKLSASGFDFTVQYIGEVAGNVSGGVRRGTVYNGLVNLASDVDFDKLAGWRGGAFHAAMLYPHGNSLTEKYAGDLFTVSNLDASDDVHLFELWLEQKFFGDQLSLRFGQMAVDQEFAFTDQGALFASAAFGWFPIAGNNVVAPVYPQGAPGVRLRWQASESAYLQFAVTDGDINPVDAAGHETNPHGVKVRFDEGAFLIGEAGYSWNLAETKPGMVKLGGWYHTARTAQMRWDDTGLSLADPLSSGTAATRGCNWGLYVAAEQVLWKENPEAKESLQGLSVFCRAGHAPSDRNTLGLYLEGGVTRTGWLPGRDNDVCGVGIAYGQLSCPVRDLSADANFFYATADPLPDYELVIEAEYQIQIRPGCAVQPGLQYIIHPGGSRAIANALVLSLRTILDF